MKKTTSTCLLVIAALSGCVSTPTPPTVTSFEVDQAFDEAERISLLPETSGSDIPTGMVSYDGQIGADVQGDAVGSILADMTMIVGFSSNDITGNVTNMNLIDLDGTPNQQLTGTLQISGIESNGSLDAAAAGEITGVDVDGFEVDSQMNLVLEGAVYDDSGTADAVFGSAEGEANGDFYLDVDGVFFGTAD